MTFTHRWKSGLNTVGAQTDGYDGSAELWVESDNPEDTGLGVLKYLINEGFVYGRVYDVGNDRDDNIVLYQIDPPQLAPGSAVLWSVTLRYRLATPDLQGSDGSPASPPNRRPSISVGSVTRAKTAEQGIYRGGLQTDWQINELREITNSAGVPFSPAIEIEETNAILRITRSATAINFNQTAFPTKWINDRIITITNRKTTISIAPFALRYSAWNTEEVFEEGFDFVRITFEGEIKKGGWRLPILDRSVMAEACEGAPDQRYGTISQSPPGAPNARNILGPDGSPVSQPVNLDGKGQPAKCGDPAHYGLWSVYDEIDPRTLPFFQGIIL